jgi:hypothetical protein
LVVVVVLFVVELESGVVVCSCVVVVLLVVGAGVESGVVVCSIVVLRLEETPGRCPLKYRNIPRTATSKAPTTKYRPPPPLESPLIGQSSGDMVTALAASSTEFNAPIQE